MKKKILIIIAGFLAVCICFGQNSYRERIVKRIENKPFVIEGDSKYEIDQTRIIAKLKPQRSLPITLCAKSQDLGFDIIEIPVPTDIMVEDYLSLLERTGDFEFVDFNTYGEYFFTPNDSLIGNQTGHQWYLDRIESGITVTLVEDGDVSKDFTPDEPWTIEIINTESGRVMTTLSSTNRSETISTAGWPKGIYIVKVTVGKEELTEKVMVK